VRARTLEEMLAFTSSQFETFNCELLCQQGYRHVRCVSGPGDLNADITRTDPQGSSAVVQCKRYTPGNRISSRTMQTLIGMAYVDHKADRAVLLLLPLIAPELIIDRPHVSHLQQSCAI
jgi:restriction system protein